MYGSRCRQISSPLPLSKARTADRAVDLALAWLDERPAGPFFLWLHLQDAHGPYLAHRLRSQALAGLGRLDEARAASDISNLLPVYRGWLSVDPWLAEVLLEGVDDSGSD